jgi:fucose 4-O-acetylase-like acetyltransferase
MDTGSSGPAGRALNREPGTRLEQWATGRLAYLDNLKVVLIAGIIAIHAVLGYASIVEVWTYTELREVTLAPATEIVLFALVSPFGFFLMALLFLVAGLLTPASYDRKGGARFIRDRLLRLGLPFVVYVLLVQPSLIYALHHRWGDATGSYWEEYLGSGRLDTGPLWFVGVLLIFSLGYAGLRLWSDSARRRASARASASPPSVATLVVAAAVVAPGSFLVRTVYSYGSESGVTDLNFWEWPACLAMFALGVVAAQHGWATAIPAHLVRQCRGVTLMGVVAMTALLVVVATLDRVDDATGGWSWPAAAFAGLDAALTVFGSVWLLDIARRRLHRTYRWGPVLSRSAYGAFMVQSVFLLGLAVALRPLGLPAEVKALTVAVGGVVTSFAVAWLLITRVPGVSRIL